MEINTKAESELQVDKERYYDIILWILQCYPAGITARQMAIEMHRRGYTPTDDANFARPRLTELKQLGRVSDTETTYDEETRRTVRLYRLPKRGEVEFPEVQGRFVL